MIKSIVSLIFILGSLNGVALGDTNIPKTTNIYDKQIIIFFEDACFMLLNNKAVYCPTSTQNLGKFDYPIKDVDMPISLFQNAEESVDILLNNSDLLDVFISSFKYPSKAIVTISEGINGKCVVAQEDNFIECTKEQNYSAHRLISDFNNMVGDPIVNDALVVLGIGAVLSLGLTAVGSPAGIIVGGPLMIAAMFSYLIKQSHKKDMNIMGISEDSIVEISPKFLDYKYVLIVDGDDYLEPVQQLRLDVLKKSLMQESPTISVSSSHRKTSGQFSRARRRAQNR